jgi:hypothetical protein
MTAYLTVTCTACHNVYRAYRVSPDGQTIKFCMYCGTSSPPPYVEIDPEWDVLDVLARSYNCTTKKVEMALSLWRDEVSECHAHHTIPPTFHDFMVPTQTPTTTQQT